MEKGDWQKRVAGHRERLRQKFLNHGLEKLTDEETIELLLTLGTPRRDSKHIAREALRRFQGLAGVLEAPEDQLRQVQGIGPKNALGLKLVHEVARKFLRERLKGREFIASSKEVYEYLVHSLRDLKKEIFKVIFLNGGLSAGGDQERSLSSCGSFSFCPQPPLGRPYALQPRFHHHPRSFSGRKDYVHPGAGSLDHWAKPLLQFRRSRSHKEMGNRIRPRTRDHSQNLGRGPRRRQAEIRGLRSEVRSPDDRGQIVQSSEYRTAEQGTAE